MSMKNSKVEAAKRTASAAMVVVAGGASAITAPVAALTASETKEAPADFPFFEGLDAKNIIVGSEFDPMKGVKAFEMVDGEKVDLTDKITILNPADVKTDVVGKITIKYSVIGSNGNEMQMEVTHNIYKPLTPEEQEKLAPKFEGAKAKTFERGEEVDVLDGIKAFDHEGNDITDRIKVSGAVREGTTLLNTDLDVSQQNAERVVFLEVADKDGNSTRATIKHNIVHFKNDEAPKIKRKEGKATVLEMGEELGDLLDYVEITDDHWDDEVNRQILLDNLKYTGSVNMSKPGEYTVTYTTQDIKGNKATLHLKFLVVERIEIDVNFEGRPQILEFGSDFDPMKGVKAIQSMKQGDEEAELTDITDRIKMKGHDKVDTSKPGSYKVEYTVFDDKGGEHTLALIHVVKPEVNTGAPVITAESKSFKLGDKIDLLSLASAKDSLGNKIDVKVKETNFVEGKTGTFKVTYEAVDKDGNIATKAINVTVVDATAPTIKPIGKLETEVGRKVEIKDLFEIKDNYDKTEDLTIHFEDNIEWNKAGTYKITVTAVDKTGNKAVESFDFVVKKKETPQPEEDKVAPEIHVNGKLEAIEGSSVDFSKLFSATDNVSRPENIKLTIDSSKVNLNKEGMYPIVVTAVDEAGNSTVETFQFHVIKKEVPKPEKPVISVNQESWEFVMGGNTSGDLNAWVNQNASVNVGKITFRDTSQVDLSNPGRYPVVYTAVNGDEVAKRTVYVNVVDKTEPLLDVTTKKATVLMGSKVGSLQELFGVKAFDNHRVSHIDTIIMRGGQVVDSVDTSQPAVYNIIFRAYDESGNSSNGLSVELSVFEGAPEGVVVINVEDKLVALQGDSSFDPLKGVLVTNGSEDITDQARIVGNYDINTVGDYPVKVVVEVDGETFEKEIVISVKAKAEYEAELEKNTPRNPIPTGVDGVATNAQAAVGFFGSLSALAAGLFTSRKKRK